MYFDSYCTAWIIWYHECGVQVGFIAGETCRPLPVYIRDMVLTAFKRCGSGPRLRCTFHKHCHDSHPCFYFRRDTASRALLPRVFNDARTFQSILGDYQASHCSPEPSNSAFSSCRALCNSISMRLPIDSYIWSSLPATLGQRPIQASNNVTKCQRAARAGTFVRTI